ncbi:MAG: hypothetical protein L6W00_15385 [Lentisphaeria bacterium]|nr:MAG: hypothetical protein L6W00_15385 [Lentisphaeria bacterium]
MAELLREHEAQESTLRFRRERGETVPDELTGTVRQFGEKCAAAAKTFRHTGSAGAELEATKELCRTVWNALLAPKTGKLRWQPGASRESFGLFGWQHGNLDLLAETAQRERLERNYFINPDGSKTMLRFRPDGAEYAGMEPAPRSINWTSRSWRYTYSLNGRKIRWELAGSWLAPGVLIDTDAPRMVIAPLSGAAKAPLRLAVPTRKGIRLLRTDELAKFRLARPLGKLAADSGRLEKSGGSPAAHPPAPPRVGRLPERRNHPQPSRWNRHSRILPALRSASAPGGVVRRLETAPGRSRRTVPPPQRRDDRLSMAVRRVLRRGPGEQPAPHRQLLLLPQNSKRLELSGPGDRPAAASPALRRPERVSGSAAGI